MPYNSSAAAPQTKHTRTMYRPHNLHTATRSILNSIQSMLSTTAIGPRLTTSSAQTMLSYLTTQHILPPPPLKINPAFVSNYTDFPLVSRATSGYPGHKHTFFIQLNKPLGMLHRAFAKGGFAVWFCLAVRSPYM